LAGRTVVVTGASSGIGEAIAGAMAGPGAKVALVGRDRDRLSAVARTVEARDGRAYICAVDLTASGAPGAVLEDVLGAFGGAIDVIVSAAGICDRARLIDSDPERFEAQWRINVGAPFELARVAAPHIPPGGSVIFVSSMAATVGFPGLAMYGATKGAIESVTRCLAIELAPRGIRVNAISPGFIETPMNAAVRALSDAEKRAITATPLGRLGAPTDVAEAAMFLASDRASFICGAVLPVSGGYPLPLAAVSDEGIA
jgi:NAD(P)-dependent dehydrogenase (short-subunit alcohol dehydrogenase family)